MKRRVMVLLAGICLSVPAASAWPILRIPVPQKAGAPVPKVSAHSVVLTWTQTPQTCTPTACPLTGNQIFRATTPGGEGTTPYATLTTAAVTYTDNAVTAGLTYYYTVTVGNVNGFSPQSTESNAAVIPNQQVPNAPTNLTGVAQ